MRITPYREAVGALMWAATMTRPDVTYAAHQLGKFNNSKPVHSGRRKGHYNICDARRWDHLQRNSGVVHKTVGMGVRRFRHLPKHSAFGLRRSGDAGGGRDQLVFEGAEGDRGRVIRIRVCGAGKSCQRAPFPLTGEGLLGPADRRQNCNQGG